DRNRSHWSTSKTPSYTKSVSWQHHHMDEEHRTWFCARYAWYCQQMMQARELELEH
ncbi:hypothetical protein POY35_24845, partial [Escherichia coli]